MNSLYDLTKKKSGIVVRPRETPILCNWSNILGLPIRFGDVVRGLGEEIPRAVGHYYDDLSDWVSGLDTGNRRIPQRGMVYNIDGIIVIAPDEWD